VDGESAVSPVIEDRQELVVMSSNGFKVGASPQDPGRRGPAHELWWRAVGVLTGGAGWHRRCSVIHHVLAVRLRSAAPSGKALRGLRPLKFAPMELSEVSVSVPVYKCAGRLVSLRARPAAVAGLGRNSGQPGWYRRTAARGSPRGRTLPAGRSMSSESATSS
jgi:hypothetical protein